MPYTKSSKAITRLFDEIKRLIASHENVEFPSNEPRKLAYAFREAINVAKNRVAEGDGEPFKTIASLSSKYLFREANGKVIAELRDTVVQPVRGLNELTISTPVDEFSIVGACIEHKGKSIQFTNVPFVNIQMVHAWAQKNNYDLMYDGQKGVTMTPSKNEND